MARKFTVVVDWVDGAVSDSDEIVVFADSAASAKKKAALKWSESVGKKWPTATKEKAWILTARSRRQFA